MRAKFFAIIMMAVVASFAWVKYHDPLGHAPQQPHFPRRPAVSVKRLEPLPSISLSEMRTMTSQGMVYGVDLNAGGTVALFLARTPDKPTNLQLRHWPPVRFAAIAVISQPAKKFGPQWSQEKQEIHWLRISPLVHSHG